MLDTGRKQEMMDALAKQKAAQIRDGIPSEQIRKDRIDRAIALLVDHREALGEAMSADFGHRSQVTNDMADIMGSVKSLKNTRKNLGGWMKPEKRSIDFPLNMFGAKGHVHNVPKGTVGILAPWNFPVAMVFQPLACVLGAGNRAMIKPSEFTESTSALLESLIPQYFDPEEIEVFTGGPDVGAAFTQLDLDHIVFTGATGIAKHVMRAAADNLVPLTLELGGKSPAILGRDADMEKAAKRIMAGKTMNAGQICLAPDYALTPHDKTGEFVDHAIASVAEMYPTLRDNDDYTSIINQRHWDRLQGYLEDARDKGGEVIEINPAGENFTQQPHRKMAPHIVLNPTDDMLVMTEEIFGPILPVKDYKVIDDAIGHVNANARPLGLYYFGGDSEAERVVNSTTSGGVTINDVIFHVANDELPFGGIGPSGMGHYHGVEGFREMSHQKSVYRQTGIEKVMAMTRPPYGKAILGQINSTIKK